jgi:hypothetical protein
MSHIQTITCVTTEKAHYERISLTALVFLISKNHRPTHLSPAYRKVCANLGLSDLRSVHCRMMSPRSPDVLFDGVTDLMRKPDFG